MRRALLTSVCGLGMIVFGTAPSQACGLFGCLFGHHGCFSPCCPPPCCPTSCFHLPSCCPTPCCAPQPCCPTGVGYAPTVCPTCPTCPTGTCQQTDPLAPATTVYQPAPAQTVYRVAPPLFPRLVERPFARPFFGPFGRTGASQTVSYPEPAPQTPPVQSEDERRPTISSMHWDALHVVR